MSIFDKVKSALSDFLNSVKSFIIKFADSFIPKAVNAAEVAIEDILEIAAQAVLDQAPKVLTGKEKFGNAVTAVIQEVESKGKQVAIQTAQAAVQLAYLEAQKIAQESKK